MAPIAKFAAIAAADPDDEPDVLLFNTYGFLVLPPLLLQPDIDLFPLKFAISDKFVFPNIIAPAFLNFTTILASFLQSPPYSSIVIDPAVVFILSSVSILSLIRIGIPCKGPFIPFFS